MFNKMKYAVAHFWVEFPVSDNSQRFFLPIISY